MHFDHIFRSTPTSTIWLMSTRCHWSATGGLGPSVPMPLSAQRRHWRAKAPASGTRTHHFAMVGQVGWDKPPSDPTPTTSAHGLTVPTVSLIWVVYRALLCLTAICLISRTAFCEPPAATERRALPTITPSPIQTTPTCMMFNSWIAAWLGLGDHGVIWRTGDGGRHWRLLRSPADWPLRSVCFLSDRVGWIVGGATMPFTRVGSASCWRRPMAAHLDRTWSRTAAAVAQRAVLFAD